MSDPIITMSDVRPFYCVKGVKKAFAEADLDFADFLKNGARASQLRGKGLDAPLDRVLASLEKGE
ncbi:hypothetical protein [Rhizobium wenxiniae]|uniref:hypothetical protein n=1 Tax=Rhizobium wenxiniae TaxID=1737357 RepID=UPI003C1FBF1F